MFVTVGMTGSLPGSFTRRRKRERSFDRKQLVIQLEARLEGETVDRGQVRKKCEAQRRLGNEIFGRSHELARGDYDSRFAPEFNHFGDGLLVPVLELLQSYIFSDFL